MQFVYHPLAGDAQLTIERERYRHLFKSRRQKLGDHLSIRNLRDDLLYRYQVDSVSKKEATVTLVSHEKSTIEHAHPLTLGWCVIDPKHIEKALPSLNELGVQKIVFIYCDRSQKGYKINLDRVEKILITSSEQCGRSSLMEIDIVDTYDLFIARYPEAVMVNFSDEHLSATGMPQSIVIGCEGGFSEREVALTPTIRGLKNNTILKSETAAIAVASTLIFKG
jgi:16S rRNA (uracil1498-N3)-methyltransferase